MVKLEHWVVVVYHKAGEFLVGDLFPPLDIREHVQRLVQDLAL